VTTNLIIAGVGGQGIVLASKLIARTAMRQGLPVRTSETIGMAQRGGSVVTHVRIGGFGEAVHSPLVPVGSAQVLIGFEPGEAVRALPYLMPGGTVVVNTRPIPPVTAALTRSEYDGSEMLEYLGRCGARLIVVDGDAIAAEVGSPKVLNTALLGAAAAAGALGLSVEEVEETIRSTMPERFVEMNVLSLRCGARHAAKDLS